MDFKVCHTVHDGDYLLYLAYLYFRRLYYSSPESKEKKKQLKVLYKEMSEAPHFSAFGFFTVDRSLLIASLATGFTYVVVLLQSS